MIAEPAVVSLDRALLQVRKEVEHLSDAPAPSPREEVLPPAKSARRIARLTARRAVVIEHGDEPAPGPKSSRPAWIVPALAAALAAGAAVTGFAVWRSMSPADTREIAALSKSAVATPPAPPAIDPADRAWSEIDRADPLELRAFAEAHPASAFARTAIAMVDQLETEALRAAGSAEDAETAFDRIAAYRLNFPSGRHDAEISALEADWRSLVEAMEASLTRQGHATRADGVIDADTRAAVAAYERRLRLTSTGRVTRPVISQILSTDLSREARTRPVAPAPTAPAPAPTAPTPAAGPSAATAPAIAVSPVAAPPPRTSAPAPFRDCSACPELAAVPAGSFAMGSETLGDDDERPVRSVSIAPFAIGVREVTFAEWDVCVAEGGCTHRPDDRGWGRGARPVINVNWSDAGQFAAWLSRKTGKAYRLPTEAEWEYAARAGGADVTPPLTDFCRLGNIADASTRYEWRNAACSDGHGMMTAPAGSFAANAFGLHDMIGNVWEWVSDCWHEGYAGAPRDGAAWVRGCASSDRILRGGAWSVRPGNARATYRYHFAPEARLAYFGFRIARDL